MTSRKILFFLSVTTICLYGCGPGPRERQTYAPPPAEDLAALKQETTESVNQRERPEARSPRTPPAITPPKVADSDTPASTTNFATPAVAPTEAPVPAPSSIPSSPVPASPPVAASVSAPETTPSPTTQSPEPDVDARELVKKSDDLMRGESNKGTYEMTIHTPQWERTLKIFVYSQGRDKIFIRILEPPKEAGVGTLRIENEMWNYIPSVEKIIKIPPSMMLQPWMGSDFANDDLVKESSIVHDYTHQVVATEEIDNHTVYKVELNPKPDAPVIWGKINRWIRKDDYVPLKEEYYNEHDELIKTLDYSDIAPVSDRTIPKTWVMTAHNKEGHFTRIRLLYVEYNIPIEDYIFSINYLKRVQ